MSDRDEQYYDLRECVARLDERLSHLETSIAELRTDLRPLAESVTRWKGGLVVAALGLGLIVTGLTALVRKWMGLAQ